MKKIFSFWMTIATVLGFSQNPLLWLKKSTGKNEKHSLGEYPAGVYFIKVNNSESSQIQKVIKNQR
jgi:hypothetical protein